MKEKIALVVVILLGLYSIFVLPIERGTKNRMVAEVGSLLANVKASQVEYYMMRGKFPRSNKDVGLNPGNELQNSILRRADILPDTRLLLTLHEVVDERRVIIILTPEMNTQSRLIWHCRSPNIPSNLKEMLFQYCIYTSEYVSGEDVVRRYQEKQKIIAESKKKRKLHMTKRRMQQNAKTKFGVKFPIQKNPFEKNITNKKVCHNFDNALGKTLVLQVGRRNTKVWRVSKDKPHFKGVIDIVLKKSIAQAVIKGGYIYFEKDLTLHIAGAHGDKIELTKTAIPIMKGSKLFTSSSHLVVAQPTGRLLFADLCLPQKPIFSSSAILPFHNSFKLQDFYLMRGVAYALASDEHEYAPRSLLASLKVSSDFYLKEVATHHFPGDAQNFSINGDRVYVANGSDGVIVFQINGFNVEPFRSMKTLDFAREIAVVNDIIVVADRLAGIALFSTNGESVTKSDELKILPGVNSVLELRNRELLIRTQKGEYRLYRFSAASQPQLKYTITNE